MNGIDLGENARLCVEGWVKGARNGDPFNQNPHCNLRRIAWRKLSFVLTFERHLTPTAAWSDLVLPAASMFESGRSLHQPPFGASDTFVIDGPLPPPGEAKTDGEICRLLARALSIPLNEEIPDEQVIRAQWERARLDPEFLRLNPDSRLPSYQELLESADFQCPVRPEDTKPMVSGYLPGEFPTETGKINFYSPFAAARQRSAYGAYRACYQPLEGGAEAIDAGLIGNTGERYTLQFVTPHVITKADASFDNTATLRALLPNAIGMHPQDAVDRGLKEGQTAYLYNDYGCIKLPVHVSVTVARGVVTLPHGAWHRPSRTERYRACFDADFDGAAEWHEVPVDVGGNSNTVTGNRNSGLVDPFIVGMGLNSNGYACEVSPQKPERGEKP
jgi:anaerobic dimethyl sulfoxide reductase subunit A